MPDYLIVGVGEVLWDFLPSGLQLGGAPANFVHHAAALGDRAVLVSRVGRDELGDRAVAQLQRAGLRVSHVQRDPDHPTGTVQVTLDARGRPDFAIHTGVAWDHLAWTDELEDLARRADAVCFGSLAQRSPRSRETLRRFLRATRPEALRVFDVNLRQAYYSAGLLRASMALAALVKLNEAELPVVCDLLGLAGRRGPEQARGLREGFDLRLVCVTRGEHGCLLVTAQETVEEPGIPVEVADTVGSGDAFTAGLVHALVRRRPLREVARLANRLGAWVATQVGAMPSIEPRQLRSLLTSPQAYQL